DPARTDSGPGQIGKAALSNRSTQGYLGLPVAPQLPQNPLRRILNPFPKAGSPKIYTHRASPVVSPEHRRLGPLRTRQARVGKKCQESRRKQAAPSSQDIQNQNLT